MSRVSRFVPRPLALISLIITAGVLSHLAFARGAFDYPAFYMVPTVPGQVSGPAGEQMGAMNLYTGHSRQEIPLVSLPGRGGTSWTPVLYYNSNVSDIVNSPNSISQASWVGAGWGLEPPFIFAHFDPRVDGEGKITTLDPDSTLVLYWNGVADSVEWAGEYDDWDATLQCRKWRIFMSFDQNNCIDTLTVWDYEGGKYIFGNRRGTNVGAYDGGWTDWTDHQYPYRWDLTDYVDVTGANAIKFDYHTQLLASYNGHSYTRAQYLNYIEDLASGQKLKFFRESRTDPDDVPSSSYWYFYEEDRLNRIELQDAGNNLIAKVVFTYDALADPPSQAKTLLSSIQRKHPTTPALDLPTTEFTYQEDNPNHGALQTITLPDGGVTTYTYTSGGANYRVSTVARDRGMGGAAETTTYTPLATSGTRFTEMRIAPPTPGYFEVMMLDSTGTNQGGAKLIQTYDEYDTLVQKTEIQPSTLHWWASSTVRDVRYAGSDSLATLTNNYYTSVGLPTRVETQMSPFQGLALSTGPGNGEDGDYWLIKETEYSAVGASDVPYQFNLPSEETLIEKFESNTAQIARERRYYVLESGEQDYYRLDAVVGFAGEPGCSEMDWGSWNNQARTLLNETYGFYLATRIDSVDSYGRVTKSVNHYGVPTWYYYGDNDHPLSNYSGHDGLDHRFLTGTKTIRGAVEYTTTTQWDEDLGVATKIVKDNNSTSYVYDDFGRLVQTENDTLAILSKIEYFSSRDSHASFDGTDPNYVKTSKYFLYPAADDTSVVVNTTYSDGFGRKLQTQRKNGSNAIISAYGYYPDGMLRAAYAPFEVTTSSYYDAVGYANRDSTYYEYEESPLRRPTKVVMQPIDDTTRSQVTSTYSIQELSGFKYQYTAVTDPQNKITRTWANRDGSVFRTSVDSDYEARTWRSALGAPITMLSPKAGESLGSAFKTTVTYNTAVEVSRSEVDQGTTKIVYNHLLQPVYMQEASDAAAHDFWATTYDSLGRATRTGKEDFGSSSWYQDTPDTANASYGGGAGEWRKKYFYDTNEAGSYNKGRLVKLTGNYDTDDDAEFWEKYTYSREGWITETSTFVDKFGTKQIQYAYDTGGRLRKSSFQPETAAERFFLWYEYDAAGRLVEIYSHTSDSKPSYPTAEYAYNARGQVTQVKVRDGTNSTVRQQIDYTFAPNGLLTKINDPESLGSDVFAMQLGYKQKVSGGSSTGWSAQENGNVSQMKWINTKWNTTPLYYTFGYDARNQITKADNSNDTYDIDSYTYDDNGNMVLRDSTTHYYTGDEANTNRIDYRTGLSSDNWDYDASGRMTKDNHSFKEITDVEYWFPGAAPQVFTTSTSYEGEDYDTWLRNYYNGSNLRIRKLYHWDAPEEDPPDDPFGGFTAMAGGGVQGDTLSAINYVRDQAGNVLAVYDGTTISERYVWGPTGLISVVKGTASGTRYFTITDHLGSIRNMVNATGTVMAGYDYYPFGAILRGSYISTANCRFTFGGKELDTEHDFDLYYFDARFYDPSIGRFLEPDALKEGWNPYSFVNNNPVNFVDPTGMFVDGLNSPNYRELTGANRGESGYYDRLLSYFPGPNCRWLQFMLIDSGMGNYIAYWQATEWEAAQQKGKDIVAYWNDKAPKKKTMEGTGSVEGVERKVKAELARMGEENSDMTAQGVAMIIYAEKMGRLSPIGADWALKALKDDYQKYVVMELVKLELDDKQENLGIETRVHGLTIWDGESKEMVVAINFKIINADFAAVGLPEPTAKGKEWNVVLALYHESFHVYGVYHEGAPNWSGFSCKWFSDKAEQLANYLYGIIPPQ